MILRHAAGCCVCSVLMVGIIFPVAVVHIASEQARPGGMYDFLSMTSQHTLQVLMFLPELLKNNYCLGYHSKEIWTWLNILFDGCVLYFLWSVARGGGRKRHGNDVPKGAGTPGRSAADQQGPAPSS